MSNFRRSYPSLNVQLDAFVQESEARMLAVMRQSIQDVVINAQTPVAKGGRMRVDTGFLRMSGQGAVGSMPSGPVRGDPAAKPGQYDPGDQGVENAIVLQLANLQPGQTFFFGWTANYARFREIYDGFLEGALQHWQRIVAINTDTLRQRIGSK